MVQSMKLFMETKPTGKVRPKIIRKLFKNVVVMEIEVEGEFGTWFGSSENEIRYRWREITIADVCKCVNFTF